uniref:Uncharacterized protein n=1 Tax=Phaeomonas parva TaxID=124430 RepID=A0A7S1UGQ5_9STRA
MRRGWDWLSQLRFSGARADYMTDEEIALAEGDAEEKATRVFPRRIRFLPNIAQMLVLRDFSPFPIEVELPGGELVGSFVLPPWCQTLRVMRAISRKLKLSGNDAGMLGLTARWHSTPGGSAKGSEELRYLRQPVESVPVQQNMSLMDLVCSLNTELDEYDPSHPVLREKTLRITLRPRVFFMALEEHAEMVHAKTFCGCKSCGVDADGNGACDDGVCGDCSGVDAGEATRGRDQVQRIMYLEAFEEIRRGILETDSAESAAVVAACIALVESRSGALGRAPRELAEEALAALPHGQREIFTARQWKTLIKKEIAARASTCTSCLRGEMLGLLKDHPLFFSHVLQADTATIRHATLPQIGANPVDLLHFQEKHHHDACLICINHNGVTLVGNRRDGPHFEKQRRSGTVLASSMSYDLKQPLAHGKAHRAYSDGMQMLFTIPIEHISSWGCGGARTFLKVRDTNGQMVEHNWNHSCRHVAVCITNFLTEIAYCLLSCNSALRAGNARQRSDPARGA